MATLPLLTTSRRSPTRRASILGLSSKVAAASTQRWLRESPIWKCCESCSVSARSRQRTFRRGTTRQGVGGTGGAVATVKAWTADGLFINQRDPEFFAVLSELAVQADEARRGF